MHLRHFRFTDFRIVVLEKTVLFYGIRYTVETDY